MRKHNRLTTSAAPAAGVVVIAPAAWSSSPMSLVERAVRLATKREIVREAGRESRLNWQLAFGVGRRQMSAYLDLYDYRRRVAAMYAERHEAFKVGENAESIWRRYRLHRDSLFRDHSQSALDEGQRRVFRGLSYFPYRADLCVPARIETGIEPTSLTIPMNADERMSMTAVAHLHFTIQGQVATMVLYWLNIYGGGLFLPFHDTTCPLECYGGGRYLCDTIKGSDLLPLPGADPQHSLLLDFNYAYNPSCAYNNRWICPLAPPENRLPFAIGAGEKKFHADV